MSLGSKARVAIVGAGILGLAHARAAAQAGYAVTVYERSAYAEGASVRNFGLCLLLGQPQGELHQMAQYSRSIWQESLAACGAWHKSGGSLVVARNLLEWEVLQAFQQQCGQAYGTELLAPKSLYQRGVQGVGGLYSGAELSLDPRAALPLLRQWLAQQYGVRFEFGTQVNGIALPWLETSKGRREADRVIVCAGHDFQTLYPQEFSALGIRRCALQMLRVANPGIALQPAVMTGLSALHYGSFNQTMEQGALLQRLRSQVESEEPELLKHGIHLIIQQMGDDGDLVIGDSHHFGETLPPFRMEEIDESLLALAGAVLGRPLKVKERWQGIYASGKRPYEIIQPERGVSAVSVTSGIGMSIGFALAERNLKNLEL
jgi:FAD dependent oxidoreductase TIGR03364